MRSDARIQLLKKLKNEIDFFDKRVGNYQHINFRNSVIRKGVYSLFVASRIAPFILSFSGMFALLSNGHKPFVLDDRKVYANVWVVNSSNGYNYEMSSFDVKYDNSIQYFTSWDVDDNKQYTRNIISYSVDKVDTQHMDDIFCMSYEELNNEYDVVSVETICKSDLSSQDMVYFDDMIQVCHVEKSKDCYKEVPERLEINLLDTFLYCTSSFTLSLILLMKTEYLFRDSTFMKNILLRFKTITDDDLDKMKKILDAYKDNYNLLNEDTNPKKRIRKRDD